MHLFRNGKFSDTDLCPQVSDVYINIYFVKVTCNHLKIRNRMYNFQTTRGREMIRKKGPI